MNVYTERTVSLSLSVSLSVCLFFPLIERFFVGAKTIC